MILYVFYNTYRKVQNRALDSHSTNYKDYLSFQINSFGEIK